MNITLFKMNESTRMVELDKDWISTIKEFKAILKRDKGSKGDKEGRLKLQATKEFTFVYHYCDYRSQFTNYSEKDRYVAALKNAELPPDFDLIKDVELYAAVEVYKDLQETPALKLLTQLKEGIHTSNKVVKKIRENLESKLESANLDEPIVKEFKGKMITVDPVDEITNRLEALIRISNLIPKTLEVLKEQENTVKVELAEAPVLRGGVAKGTREDAPLTQQSSPIPNAFNNIPS